ncbi:MAG: hypothetical protein LBQ40_00485 [Clostridiales bacterium]|jgi:hypothetical protein|nr:hypothetical protein [Clostridiales bacterium]
MSGSALQPYEFLIFAVCGALCAVFYAVFWLIRHFVGQDGFFEILSDFTFVILSGAAFLFCLLTATDGTLKFFYFLAYLSSFFLVLFILNTFKSGIIALLKKLYLKLKSNRLFVLISKKSKDCQENLVKKRAARQKAYDERLAARQKAHDEKLAEHKKAHDGKIAARQKAHDEKLAARQKAHDEKLAARQKAHDEKIAERKKADAERLAARQKADAGPVRENTGNKQKQEKKKKEKERKEENITNKKRSDSPKKR